MLPENLFIHGVCVREAGFGAGFIAGSNGQWLARRRVRPLIGERPLPGARPAGRRRSRFREPLAGAVKPYSRGVTPSPVS